ncbi:MAG TPA: DUF4870 domain-containing protein [Dehalococcoidia bacterium]|nr:DUF4870 domain-containing protein [Dehalococcoidia bacterium]
MAKARAKAKGKTTRKATGRAGGKTSTGLEPNVAGLLCYVLGWVTGLVFFLLEPKNKFVRFHAMQSIITFGAFTVVWFVIGMFSLIPVLGIAFSVINGIIGLFALVLWIVLMVRAYQGEKFKLPVAGDIAERQA